MTFIWMIKEVRGIGLMIRLELRAEVGGARQYCEKLKEKGLLCNETRDHIIRFAPPLIIKRDEVDSTLEQIYSVFTPNPG